MIIKFCHGYTSASLNQKDAIVLGNRMQVAINLSLFFFSCPCSLPLEGMKRKIMRNLRTLEEEGMVNSKNDYQEIINAIAKVKKKISLYICSYVLTISIYQAHLYKFYVTIFC